MGKAEVFNEYAKDVLIMAEVLFERAEVYMVYAEHYDVKIVYDSRIKMTSAFYFKVNFKRDKQLIIAYL